MLVRPIAIDKCLAESSPPHSELMERISILDSTVSTNYFGHDLFRQCDKMVRRDLMLPNPVGSSTFSAAHNSDFSLVPKSISVLRSTTGLHFSI